MSADLLLRIFENKKLVSDCLPSCELTRHVRSAALYVCATSLRLPPMFLGTPRAKVVHQNNHVPPTWRIVTVPRSKRKPRKGPAKSNTSDAHGFTLVVQVHRTDGAPPPKFLQIGLTSIAQYRVTSGWLQKWTFTSCPALHSEVTHRPAPTLVLQPLSLRVSPACPKTHSKAAQVIYFDVDPGFSAEGA